MYLESQNSKSLDVGVNDVCACAACVWNCGGACETGCDNGCTGCDGGCFGCTGTCITHSVYSVIK